MSCLHELLAICCLQWVACNRLLAIGCLHELLAMSCLHELLAIGCLQWVACNRLLAWVACNRLLAIGCLQWVACNRLLAMSCLQFATGGCFNSHEEILNELSNSLDLTQVEQVSKRTNEYVWRRVSVQMYKWVSVTKSECPNVQMSKCTKLWLTAVSLVCQMIWRSRGCGNGQMHERH